MQHFMILCICIYIYLHLHIYAGNIYIYTDLIYIIHFTSLYDVKHTHYHINKHKIQQVFTSLTYIEVQKHPSNMPCHLAIHNHNETVQKKIMINGMQ